MKTLLSNNNIQLNNKPHNGQSGQHNNIDQKLNEINLKSVKSGTGSSARIEHHPPKVFLKNKPVNWLFFREYLKNKCSERVIRDRIRYAKRYQHCLFNHDFSELNKVPEYKQKMILKGLSALSKYLGLYENFKSLMNSYGLKWASGKLEELLLARMSNVADTGSVLDWITKVVEKNPEFKSFINFMMISGLRFEESLNSYNLIIELSKKNKLDSYYEKEKTILQHYLFKDYFIRRTKKAFVSFVPSEIIDEICRNKKLTKPKIYCKLRRQGFNSRFSDIREYYATFMTKFLKIAEIDYLQGRVSASVFMRNYFNPALIVDLKERIFKGISELITK